MKHNHLGKTNMGMRLLLVLMFLMTILPSAYSQDEEDMPEELAHFLERLGILEKSFEMPFGEPDTVDTLLNGLYRNIAFWGVAMDTVETKAAVNAYLSIRWPQQEQNVLLDYLKTSVHDKVKLYRAKQVLAAVCILGHRVDTPDFSQFVVSTIPILAECEREANLEGKRSTRLNAFVCYWAVQSLGLCDNSRYAALLRTAFFDSWRVGTPLTGCPPLRTVLALFMHTAPSTYIHSEVGQVSLFEWRCLLKHVYTDTWTREGKSILHFGKFFPCHRFMTAPAV